MHCALFTESRLGGDEICGFTLIANMQITLYRISMPQDLTSTSNHHASMHLLIYKNKKGPYHMMQTPIIPCVPNYIAILKEWHEISLRTIAPVPVSYHARSCLSMHLIAELWHRPCRPRITLAPH